MAISSAMEFDVRTTGADTNSGAFKAGATGTDRSQQDSAQITYSDLVIGSTTTQLTSSANPFTSAEVGNTIRISSGTGFTTGIYEVVSVSGSVATMDRSVGTASSTGGNGKLGGALATPIPAAAAMVSGNTVWIRSGTYTLTAPAALTGTVTVGSFIGYGSTHGDGGTAPTITTATNSVELFQLWGSSIVLFDNLALTTTAATPSNGISTGNHGAVTAAVIVGCTLSGFANGVCGNNDATHYTFSTLNLLRTEVKNCTVGVQNNSGTLNVAASYIHGNTGNGIFCTTLGFAERTIFASNGGAGLFVNLSSIYPAIRSCTFAANGASGLSIVGDYGLIENCIFYGNTGRGISNTSGSTYTFYVANNAFGANTIAAYTTPLILPAAGQVTLTANPFTDSPSGDYSLNATAGGGALCKAAGYGVASFGTTYLDIGAIQSQGSSGSSSGGGNYGFIA